MCPLETVRGPENTRLDYDGNYCRDNFRCTRTYQHLIDHFFLPFFDATGGYRKNLNQLRLGFAGQQNLYTVTFIDRNKFIAVIHTRNILIPTF